MKQALAGLVLGAPLAAMITSFVALWMPQGWASLLVPIVVLVFPVWAGVVALSLLLDSARWAWITLILANLACFGLVSLSLRWHSGV